MARFLTIFLLVMAATFNVHTGIATPYALADEASPDDLHVRQLLRFSDSLVYDEPMTALAYANEALALSEEMGNDSLVAQCVYRRASALWSKGDLTQALEELKRCLALAEVLRDELLITRSYIRLGSLYTSIEDHPDAIRYYNLALDGARSLQNWKHVAMIFNNLGYSYLRSKMLDSAEYYLQRALWLQNDAYAVQKPLILYNLGDVQYNKGNHDQARVLLQECLDVANERSDRRALIRCNQLLAEIELVSGNIERASKLSATALKLAEVSMVKELLYMTNRTRANVLSAAGRHKEAYEKQSLAVAYRDSLQAADIKNRLSLFDFERTGKELEELRARNELSEVKQNFQQVMIVTISIIAGLAIIMAYLFYRSRTTKVVANRLLELKNEQIASQAKELADLNTFMTKLIAIISHDLKSPIQGLFSITDILKNKLTDPKDLEEALPSLRTSLKHCNNKINDLLKWSGGNLDEQFVKKEVVRLEEVLETTISDLQEDADHKAVHVSRYCLEDSFILADPNIVQTVLRNLLHNAIKFSRKGGEVTIRTQKQDREFIVSIADKGVGMSNEQMTNLFKARKDVSKGTVGEKGSGIGLVICRDLLKMIDGRLWAISEKDVGTTFFIAFPQAEDVPAPFMAPAKVV